MTDRRQPLTAQELVLRHRLLGRVDYGLMRREADVFFGTEDRVGEDDLLSGDQVSSVRGDRSVQA